MGHWNRNYSTAGIGIAHWSKYYQSTQWGYRFVVALEYYSNLLIFVYGYEWQSLVMYGYLLLTMLMDGYHWLCMVTDGYWILSIVIDGFHWLETVIDSYG